MPALIDRPPPPAAPLTRLERHFGDRVVRCFAERPAGVWALVEAAARRRPEGEALVCEPRRLTWQAARELALRVAAGLQARGVQPGQRIALLLGNDIEFVIATFAAAALGAVVVPLSTREQTPGLAYILAHSGAAVLVHEAALAARLPEARETPQLRLRIVVGGPADGAEPFDALAAAAPLAQPAAVAEEDVATLLYTSGTTGLPKGAMLTHLNIVHSALHYQHALRLGEGERGVVVAPLSHVTGLVAMAMVLAHLAGTIVIAREFKAGDFLALAARERMTFTIMVPAMYALCLLQPQLSRFDLSAWRVGGFGGAPMTPAVLDELTARLPRLALSNCYGATETTSPATVMPAHETAAHLDSVGRAVACAEIAVMDDEGRECPRGEVGEIWLKGPMVAQGYWRNPEATAEHIVAGYWRSGDLGRLDAEGYLHVLDRRKDTLNRGGYKIYSVEVENVLCQHPDVLEAAVVARPCPVLGERVHAFVAAKAGQALDAAALRAFCAARLADYKVPETFTLTDQPLPRNANGKLMKRDLRDALLRSPA